MQFIPHPVTTGFTAGIAVVIAVLQLKDVLGVTLPRTDGTLDYIAKLWAARAGVNGWDLGIGAVTVALLVILPKIIKRVPAPLIALVLVSLGVVLLQHLVPGFHATTIGSKFSAQIGDEVVRGIPPLPPLPIVPWHEGGGFALDYHMIRALLPSAFAIAMLGAIESLMAAVVADGMSGTKHDPNSELIALGIANMVVPFFGGIAATGALARTATNIRAGARSPIAAALHAVFVLACTISLAPLVAYLPMAALAGLLIIVARNMSDTRHFVRLARIAPRSDVVVMLVCFGLTVGFDMVIAVTVGVVLAALLFMRRMAVLTKIDLAPGPLSPAEMPAGVRLYEIAGPMFFGAAQMAMEALATVGGTDRVVILSMRAVPTMDSTGLVALESSLDRLFRSGKKVIFAGLVPEVAEMLDRAGMRRDPGRLAYAPDLDTAISMAIVHTARTSRAQSPLAITS
jgi:SulP family sulfate permease